MQNINMNTIIAIITASIALLIFNLYKRWDLTRQAKKYGIDTDQTSNLSNLELANLIQAHMRIKYISDTMMVKQFTEEGRNITCPNRPLLMSKDSVKFIIRMVMSEMHELSRTVCKTEDESVNFMQECLDTIDLCKKDLYNLSDDEKMANQLDALVDAYYYMLDTACKHGFNFSSMFNIVHKANMSKRWTDGKFHRREDGKILKPDNWKEPNTHGEILRQLVDGSWMN